MRSNMSRISCKVSEKMSYCVINMIINVPSTNGSPGDTGQGAARLGKHLALINISLPSVSHDHNQGHDAYIRMVNHLERCIKPYLALISPKLNKSLDQ